MKFVAPLSDMDREALAAMHRSGPTHRQRQRAQAILLSAQGYTLDQLADIAQTDRDTVSRWIDQWQAQGLAGLADRPKSGRPSKIDVALEAHLRDLLQNPTPDLKSLVQADLQKRGSASAGILSDALCDGAATPSEEPAGSRPKLPIPKRWRGSNEL